MPFDARRSAAPEEPLQSPDNFVFPEAPEASSRPDTRLPELGAAAFLLRALVARSWGPLRVGFALRDPLLLALFLGLGAAVSAAWLGRRLGRRGPFIASAVLYGLCFTWYCLLSDRGATLSAAVYFLLTLDAARVARSMRRSG